MKFRSIALPIALLLMLASPSVSQLKDNGWLGRVPESEHRQKSPICKNAASIAEGRNTFRDHCAQCHGENALGTNRASTLITARVQRRATDGDLHWLLVNGNKEKGMPAWAKLGDLKIWQVVSYVRSLR
jgi:mono/diheme cytochrome c family protein